MIRDFIKILKRSWAEYNKEKIAATQAKNEVKTMLDGQNHVYNILMYACSNLEFLYLYCPKYERNAYIQPFLDFAKYRILKSPATKENSAVYRDYGYLDKLHYVISSLESKYHIVECMYKEKRYAECIEEAKNAIEFVKNEYAEVDALCIKPNNEKH